MRVETRKREVLLVLDGKRSQDTDVSNASGFDRPPNDGPPSSTSPANWHRSIWNRPAPSSRIVVARRGRPTASESEAPSPRTNRFANIRDRGRTSHAQLLVAKRRPRPRSSLLSSPPITPPSIPSRPHRSAHEEDHMAAGLTPPIGSSRCPRTYSFSPTHSSLARVGGTDQMGERSLLQGSFDAPPRSSLSGTIKNVKHALVLVSTSKHAASDGRSARCFRVRRSRVSTSVRKDRLVPRFRREGSRKRVRSGIVRVVSRSSVHASSGDKQQERRRIERRTVQRLRYPCDGYGSSSSICHDAGRRDGRKRCTAACSTGAYAHVFVRRRSGSQRFRSGESSISGAESIACSKSMDVLTWIFLRMLFVLRWIRESTATLGALLPGWTRGFDPRVPRHHHQALLGIRIRQFQQSRGCHKSD